MGIDALRAALVTHGGTLADVVNDSVPTAGQPADGADGTALAPGIGAPQRAAVDPEQYELLLEMILEGTLLHYGRPRVVRTEDRDLALLLGDQLYALGLSRLAELGDLDSVSELADIISLLSQAQLDGDSGLAHAVWDAGAVAIGWGVTSEHEAAKALARAGDATATAALLQCGGRAALSSVPDASVN
jgi:hypothetical protein